MADRSVFDAAGGMPFFVALADRFYEGVVADPVLRAVYPEEDLAGASHRLGLFLAQYWGGPTTYSDERGHPRLRMRHLPFEIGPAARDAWLARMREAVAALEPPADVSQALLAYFDMAAEAMRNRE